jgi:hypothetical protein
MGNGTAVTGHVSFLDNSWASLTILDSRKLFAWRNIGRHAHEHAVTFRFTYVCPGYHRWHRGLL